MTSGRNRNHPGCAFQQIHGGETVLAISCSSFGLISWSIQFYWLVLFRLNSSYWCEFWHSGVRRTDFRRNLSTSGPEHQRSLFLGVMTRGSNVNQPGGTSHCRLLLLRGFVIAIRYRKLNSVQLRYYFDALALYHLCCLAAYILTLVVRRTDFLWNLPTSGPSANEACQLGLRPEVVTCTLLGDLKFCGGCFYWVVCLVYFTYN